MEAGRDRAAPCLVSHRETPPSLQDLEAFFFFFFTLVTGPGRSLSLKLSDTRVYEPHIRARLGTTAHYRLAQIGLRKQPWQFNPSIHLM